MPRFEAEIPDGMRLGVAQGSDGGMRGLLFDKATNNLMGQAVFFEVNEEDEDPQWGDPYPGGADPQREREEREQLIEDLAATVALLIAVAPHVQKWWRDKARPAFRSTQRKVKARRERKAGTDKAADPILAADVVALDNPTASKSSHKEVVDLQAIGPTMSSTEAWQRFSDAVAAMAFARDQMRLLHNARIVDDDGPMEIASVLQELSPEGVEEAIHLMLAADPSMLDRKYAASFRMIPATIEPDGGRESAGEGTPEELVRHVDDER